MPLSASFPDLVGLDLFLSVVREGSVSKAAAIHGMAQPSASTRIKTLEQQLGLVLLERSPTGSRPTDAGGLVAGWAERVVHSAEALTAGVNALKADASGELRLASSFTIAEYLLPSWLERHQHERAEDRVELRVANSAAVLDAVRSGDVELGFIESPADPSDLSEADVATDSLVTVVSPTHPWANRTAVPVEALVITPLVVRERGSGTRDALVAALESLGYDEPLTHLELGSTSAVKAAVRTGGSPGVLSDLAVSDDVSAGRLAIAHVRGLKIKRRLRVVWSDERPLSGSAQSLLRRLTTS